ncbi:MAG: DUF5337 family protein [Rhodobacteraceae bacterium]|nr:DUF5337 family protein [Paracoccaceae bacterium]
MIRVPGERRDGASRIRLSACVIVCAMLIWLGGSWLGGVLNWPVKFAFLLDFAVLAALAWAVLSLIRFPTRRKGGSG